MTQSKNTVELLEFLSNSLWLEHCRPISPKSRASKIPAGVTYLSQLLAHDMFMTEPRKNVFHSIAESPGKSIAVNLVKTPLVLDTIYGRAGVADLPLYSEKDPRRFDLFSFPRNGKCFWTPNFHRDPRENWSHPILADARNYSTPILAQIAFAFMAYHNRLVEAFDAQGADNNDIFALARANVILTWHKIIQNDIIDSTCRKFAKKHISKFMQRKDIRSQPEILPLGVFRCFHALVRENYLFNETAIKAGDPSKVESVLSAKSRGPAIGAERDRGRYSEAMKALVAEWLITWEVDLRMFFDDASLSIPALNRTGFTPSFTFARVDRADNKKKPIQILDTSRAEGLNHDGLLEEDSIFSAVNALIADVKDVSTGSVIVPQDSVPLHIALLAEGFYDTECHDGDLGKLGRIGSAIGRYWLGVELDRAKRLVDEVVETIQGRAWMPDAENLPKNFVQMTNMTRKSDFDFITKRGNSNV